MRPLKLLTAFSSLLLIAFSSTTATSQNQAANTPPARVTDFARSEAPNDHTVGSEDAAITMIVWASVTCPHCANWFSNEWPIVKRDLVDTGKLRFVFREFPTAPPQLAMTGFRMANCAPTEDYMSIIEYQMKNQDMIFAEAKEGRGQEVYGKIAKLAGMDNNEAIATCFQNPDITAQIIDNVDRATLAGIKGVPAFLVNGETYKGATDAKTLISLISDMDEKGFSTLPKDIKPAAKHAGHKHD